MNESKLKEHHKQQDLCTTRPAYRQGRNLTAVKVYTSARIAKRLLDTKSFYGGILHVCYAPECESVQETKTKLLQRKRDILNRLPKETNFNNT
ncbi:hypothetical protein NQ314_000881 [Rhamnusium bicolor]|uniref:RNA-binding protein 48 n=1 Tax=Rhamnusium bicolor TaxID=1586634 RepID=A0AAV8ZTA5_9CUCU|nr:hypothetical protein NQ314_000881 [Rhamnusium bicolor]